MATVEQGLNDLRHGLSAHRWGAARVRALALHLVDHPDESEQFPLLGYNTWPVLDAVLRELRERGVRVLGSGADGVSSLDVLRCASEKRQRAFKVFADPFRRAMAVRENRLLPGEIAATIATAGGCDAETARSMMWEALFPCERHYRVRQAFTLDGVFTKLLTAYPQVVIEDSFHGGAQGEVGIGWTDLMDAAAIADRATLALLTRAWLVRCGSASSLWRAVSRTQHMLSTRRRWQLVDSAVLEPYRNEAMAIAEIATVVVVGGHVVTQVSRRLFMGSRALAASAVVGEYRSRRMAVSQRLRRSVAYRRGGMRWWHHSIVRKRWPRT